MFPIGNKILSKFFVSTDEVVKMTSTLHRKSFYCIASKCGIGNRVTDGSHCEILRSSFLEFNISVYLMTNLGSIREL